MPGFLVDSSAWLASVLDLHPHHGEAQRQLAIASPRAPAAFCRATQLSFLRLLTTPAILKAYGLETMTNRSAWAAFELLRSRPEVTLLDEPAGTVALWQELASLETASPKVWMDAYLAAFAVRAGLPLLTFDRDFLGFVPRGLRLVAIERP